MAIDFHNINRIDGRKWLAVTTKGSLTKHFRRDEIEDIDIAKACDRLRSAVMLQYSCVERNSVPAWSEMNSNLFRNVSYLGFYVVRIYQQQISYLLDQSVELLRYCQFGQHIIKKIHQGGSGKKGQTRIQTKCIPEVISTYEDFINQVLELQQWARRHDLTSTQETTISCRDDHLLKESRFRMPRLLSTSNDFLNDVVPEFGKATPDEIQIFSDLFTTLRLGMVTAKQSIKRKVPFPDEVLAVKAKRAHIENEDRFLGNPHEDDFFTTLRLDVVTAKQSIKRKVPFPDEVLAVKAKRAHIENGNGTTNRPRTFVMFNFAEDRFLGNPHEDDFFDDLCYFDEAVDTLENDLSSIPNAPLCSIVRTLNQKKSVMRKAKTRVSRAVDEKIRMSGQEIKANLANLYMCTRPIAKAPAGKTARKRNANSLLSIQNSRKIKGVPLPKKPIISGVESEEMYLNILHNIFGWYPSDDFAYTVCPKWRRVRRPRKKSTVPMDVVEASSIGDFEEQPLGWIDCNNESEWSIPDTLAKLLQQWQGTNAYAPYGEIQFSHFLSATNKRKSAAKAFASLLNLTAKGFIVMTKSKDSTTVETIRVGKQLDTLQPSSFVEIGFHN